jgi:hypothetical protein
MGWFHNHANLPYDFVSVGSVVDMNVSEVAAKQVILRNVSVLHVNSFFRKIQATQTVRSLLW